ncbi:unnamed protein product [Adineta steineri]|uniref:Uncharacterized protein n=1 Tax=Adineta steineri TaxID=433720 RepID=A0A814T121_9BILA|nr:unnamed protein product [Adineta steineri]CAF3953477.1 unnamed protein product [Adineta steineri]
MPFEGQKRIYTACGILFTVSVLYITANALPIWVTGSFEPTVVTFGLWKICGKNKDISNCVNMPSVVDDKTTATQAFITICCILAPLSVISILSIILVNENLKKHMSVLAKVLAIASLISGIIGIGLGISFVVDIIKGIDALKSIPGFTIEAASKIGDFKMGVSCILAIVAVALNLVGAVITFLIR